MLDNFLNCMYFGLCNVLLNRILKGMKMMLKVKKTTSLLFATILVLVLALAGCSSTEEGSSGEKGDSAQKITVFNSKVEIVEQLEALAEEYTKETGVEVEVWGATGDGYAQQLQTKLTSNQGPSIFSIRLAEAEKLESYLYDMSNEAYVKHIAPNMELKVDGKVVGVPYGVEGYGLVYNKSLVNAENVNDYDSFVSTLKELKSEDVSGLSLSQEAFFLIGHIINTPFALQEDPVAFVEKLNNGEVTMAETKEFQEFAKFMDAIKANTNNPLEVTYDSQMGDFATGKTAMIHQGNWSYGMFADYGDLGFELGMMPFPLEGNAKLAVGVGNNWAINGTADEAEIKAASDFLNWMFTSEVGKRYIVEEFGFIPALTNIEAAELDPLSTAVLEASNKGETIPWVFHRFPPNIVVNDLVPATQEYFLSSDMTGEELLEKLDAAWANGAK
jgi:raffinose/stachyose/melibiose transport system substrate-binding protein